MVREQVKCYENKESYDEANLLPVTTYVTERGRVFIVLFISVLCRLLCRV
jgi:hypothetical protein